ncbi:MAG: glycosyltransferase [Candidatus Thermoplasmatota archaeon]|nr:glycosyltransferase [Candidatus Thermoplasmatota archaeon]
MDNRVLVLTKWTEQRRPDIYVEVAKILGRRCEFIIAGHWDNPVYFETIRKMISDANSNGSNVRLMVDPSEDEAHILYHESRIFLRLSFGERGTGQGILDAIGHAIPLVLGKGIGGISGIEDKKHGIFVDSENPTSIALQVNKILLDQNLWSTFSNNVRILAKEYTWQRYYDILINGHKTSIMGKKSKNAKRIL